MVATLTPRPSRSTPTTHCGVARVLIGAVAVGSLSLILVVPLASAGQRPCRYGRTPIARARHAEMQNAVVCLINRQRRRHGLPALRANSELDRSAQGWTNAMVSRRDFTHGSDFSARISAVGFHWSNAGENIATGYETPVAVVAAWMASTGHCQNILSPTFREVGTGVSNHSIAGSSSLAGTWTQDFGLRMSQHPASGNRGPAAGCPYR
jgi:uncharacterized protein YkwD